ncbi:NEDD8-conjugating protein ubc12 [Apophysomyces sp. BC1034]|nr:NEDD8-conjugating protein ubc12 [Apophysomyces sp. BC1015]KAG0171050.1 NEDD8-conjugating protein ubc12 [Apophysomyces sp. BC1021]KAG0188156.1 NEDD8-conjugating protein ubc12 [Apophysomyces sp. BC1034]
MLKIWTMKTKEAAAEKKKPKTSAAQIRVQKDLGELEIPSTIKLEFPDPADILNLNVTITPDEGDGSEDYLKADTFFSPGFYTGGHFKFTFAINNNYPHEPPKVHCVQKIYHPNIDLEGNICLNILREDWKPVLSLHSVLVGLQYLFLEPNADDPLNKEAAKDLMQDRRSFESNVRRLLAGGSFRDEVYDNVLG